MRVAPSTRASSSHIPMHQNAVGYITSYGIFHEPRFRSQLRNLHAPLDHRSVLGLFPSAPVICVAGSCGSAHELHHVSSRVAEAVDASCNAYPHQGFFRGPRMTGRRNVTHSPPRGQPTDDPECGGLKLRISTSSSVAGSSLKRLCPCTPCATDAKGCEPSTWVACPPCQFAVFHADNVMVGWREREREEGCARGAKVGRTLEA